MQQLAPKLDTIAVGWVRLRPVLPQRVEHDLADCLAGLARERARQLHGFGVANMNLIPHGCFLGREAARLVQMYLRVGAATTKWASRRKAIACRIRCESYSNRFCWDLCR
jgi:hypothetical protein